MEAGEIFFKLFVLHCPCLPPCYSSRFLIIRHDIRKEREEAGTAQRINRENEELLGMRKQIILTHLARYTGPHWVYQQLRGTGSETCEKKKREGYLENIRHSLPPHWNLVNNLMDVYKINETKDTRNEVPFRLNNLLDNISKEYARKAGSRALLFEHRQNISDITVEETADKLEQNIGQSADKRHQDSPLRVRSVSIPSTWREDYMWRSVIPTSVWTRRHWNVSSVRSSVRRRR